MSADRRYSRALRLTLLGTLYAALIVWPMVQKADAQTAATGAATTVVNTGNIVNIVGGVRVDVNGVLNQQDDRGRAQVLEARRRALQAVPGDLNQPTKLRMVSLKKLDEAIDECLKSGKVLPDEIKYLAGLQRVQYVFVYPEEKDVVLAGPAEGWKLSEAGTVVGNVSGHPVLQLDDLLVALRFADAARNGGMSVSIDPTAEGLQRLKDFTEKLTPGANKQAAIEGINQALGPQKITVNGLPASTRFANVMVAADYRMKCLGMGVDPSPVKGLVSYLQLGATGGGTLPRWWLAPKYDPLLTDGQGLAWELRGPGVMCMAEEDLFSPSGHREQTMKAGSLAQKWADAMTSHYDELSQKEAVFGDLRNCMDLAVVGALIAKEHLLDKADLRLNDLMSPQQLPTTMYNSPKQVDTKSSFVRRTVISGGVQLQPWDLVQKQEKSDAVTPIRSSAWNTHSNRWWWN